MSSINSLLTSVLATPTSVLQQVVESIVATPVSILSSVAQAVLETPHSQIQSVVDQLTVISTIVSVAQQVTIPIPDPLDTLLGLTPTPTPSPDSLSLTPSLSIDTHSDLSVTDVFVSPITSSDLGVVSSTSSADPNAATVVPVTSTTVDAGLITPTPTPTSTTDTLTSTYLPDSASASNMTTTPTIPNEFLALGYTAVPRAILDTFSKSACLNPIGEFEAATITRSPEPVSFPTEAQIMIDTDATPYSMWPAWVRKSGNWRKGRFRYMRSGGLSTATSTVMARCFTTAAPVA
ncbi:hypothetical protein DFS34DRAFT_637522 [Phlyctochytrium arcticum]|nr:hypothetical protein DFS34DRAFT_637522 [Phlyctochytrium arcticum]